MGKGFSLILILSALPLTPIDFFCAVVRVAMEQMVPMVETAATAARALDKVSLMAATEATGA